MADPAEIAGDQVKEANGRALLIYSRQKRWLQNWTRMCLKAAPWLIKKLAQILGLIIKNSKNKRKKYPKVAHRHRVNHRFKTTFV